MDIAEAEAHSKPPNCAIIVPLKGGLTSMVEENKKKTVKQRPPRRSWLRRFGSVLKWMFILGILGILFAGGAV
ncbi:hypothetical protein, partial [Paenibacillus riograndensis]|uniref:hypothetical protein n=1 Tax=Paenibacillus riograndensis TaxID=483937 RepID=UPI001B7FAB6F